MFIYARCEQCDLIGGPTYLLTLSDMDFFEPSVMGGGGGRGMPPS